MLSSEAILGCSYPLKIDRSQKQFTGIRGVEVGKAHNTLCNRATGSALTGDRKLKIEDTLGLGKDRL